VKSCDASDFKKNEFQAGKTPEELIEVLKKDGFKVPQQKDAISSLNDLLKDPASSDKLLELAKDKILSKQAINVFGSKIFMENASWPLRPQEVRVILRTQYPHAVPDRSSPEVSYQDQVMASSKMTGPTKETVLDKIKNLFTRR